MTVSISASLCTGAIAGRHVERPGSGLECGSVIRSNRPNFGAEHHCHMLHAWGDQREQLQPLARHSRFCADETGHVPAGAGQACNKALADRVGHGHKDERDRPDLLLNRSRYWSPLREDHFGLQVEQLFRIRARFLDVSSSPPNVDPQIAVVGPTQLRKRLHKHGDEGPCFGVFAKGHHHGDPPHSFRLLRVRRERPRRRAEPRDELPSTHPLSPEAALSIAYRSWGCKSGLEVEVLPNFFAAREAGSISATRLGRMRPLL
jgi:hypothetical protein